MERNIMHHLNPHQYEQYLSPFGKKVLRELMKQWKTGLDHNRSEQQRQQSFPDTNRKVLTFNNSHEINTPIQLEKNYIENEELNFTLLGNNLPVVPTSVELITTTVQDNNLGKHFVCSNVSIGRDLDYDVYKTTSDDEAPFDYNKDKECNMHINEAKNIDWDDMFDSEILPDPATNVNLDINSYLRNEKTSEIPLIHDRTGDESNHAKVVNSITKIPKRKNQTKVTDTIPRKVKKIKNDQLPEQMEDNNNEIYQSESTYKKKCVSEVKTTKISFRKQKYTKAVKNWLNDVNPNNVVNEEEVNCTNTAVNTETDKLNRDVGGVKMTTKRKKIIQAQLTNKDGVMKFSKPKQPTETNKPVNENALIEKEVIKEKKVKKFIAPIKSQIPVKDIVYEVCYVEASNIEEFKLLDVTDKDIFVTLIYSNGFSQLNSQHTEDTCVPDGIILNNGDIFYYFKVSSSRIREILIHLFENNKIICYDGKTILIYLASEFQIEINSWRIYDAQIGGSLLDPDNPPENFSELQKLLALSPQYTVATECNLQKAAWYVSLLRECWAGLSHQLVQDSMWSVFVDIEMQLLPIVASMERRGVKVDLARLKCMEQILLNKMKRVEEQCYAAAGKVFQINSAVQVRAIVYDQLQLDTKCNVQIKETICKGAKSTSETMLRSLVSEHPLPGLILEYRQLHKAHATFLAGIAHHVKDGVVRPTWVQTAAATGRMASNNPNLQAIPKAPFSSVTFPAAEEKEPEQLKFRSVYVARAGHVLLGADFKQMECRVFALAAADAGLLHALGTDDDLFRVLAAKWLNKARAAVSDADRERTKRIVYASMYGAGAGKLMDMLGVDYERALALAASFNGAFPSLKSFCRAAAARCAAGAGRLAAGSGRARRLPHIASDDRALRAHAERQAVNFVVQGAAADVCKTAMVATTQALRGRGPARAHLLLQLHDELVWEVERDHLQEVAQVVKRVMEECGRRCGLAAALPVALSCGASWGDMADLAIGSLPPVTGPCRCRQ